MHTHVQNVYLTVAMIKEVQVLLIHWNSFTIILGGAL